MALVIGKRSTRKFKVTAEEPGDLLEVTKHNFDVEWSVLTKDKVNEIRSILGDQEAVDTEIKAALVNVSGVKLEDGSDVEFTPELKEILFNTSWVYSALFTSFWEVQNGVTQAAHYKALKAKN